MDTLYIHLFTLVEIVSVPENILSLFAPQISFHNSCEIQLLLGLGTLFVVHISPDKKNVNSSSLIVLFDL